MLFVPAEPPPATRASAAVAPGYRLAQVGHVVVVRLDAQPTPRALAALAADVARAHDAAGRPLVYVAVFPPDARAVPAELRPLMGEFARYVSGVSAEVHLVLMAGGFAGALLRSAVTAVAILTRERNLTIHRTLEDALAAIRPALAPADADAVERAARSLVAAD